MRPVLYGLGVVILLAVTIGIYTVVSNSGPHKAVGLGVVKATVLLNPISWVLYILGFATTYLSTK